MHRVSTDAEYLDSGKVVIDVDGIPVDISGPAESISGSGWVAYKRAGRVDLHLNGVGQQFALAAGWRPGSPLTMPIAVGKAEDTARFLISTGGEVTFQSHVFPVHGFVSYFAQK